MLKVQLDQQLKISRTLLSSYIYTSAHSGFIQENIESHNLRNSSFFIPFKHASADRSSNSASNFSLNIPSCFFMRQIRSEEHTSELQSRFDLVCRLLLE